MKDIFRDKAVIVTGASSGIGEAVAREFAREGSKVMLAARSQEKLASITDEITSSGGIADYVVTDVSVENDCRNLVNKTVEKFGTVDILINNAGLSMRALFDDVDLDVIRRLMDVNFWGTVYCTKFALPYIVAGKVIHSGSVLSRWFSWITGPYGILSIKIRNSWLARDYKDREPEKGPACDDNCSGLYGNGNTKTCTDSRWNGTGSLPAQ